MLSDGITLAIIGMTVVFSFLVLLVGAMKLLSLVALKFPDPEPVPAAASAGNELEIAAAIAAAIHYRKK